jgi:hypothetical protein
LELLSFLKEESWGFEIITQCVFFLYVVNSEPAEQFP